MDFETARIEVKRRWREIMPTITGIAKEPVNREKSYICPFCGHGNHGDGMTFAPKSADNTMLHCFSCGFSGDIIALTQQLDGSEFKEALQKCAGTLGIVVDESYTPNKSRTQEEAPKAESTAEAGKNKEQAAALMQSIEAMTYLAARGISTQTAELCNIGFNPALKPRKGDPAPAIIIPVEKGQYIGRYLNEAETNGQRYNNSPGEMGFFNAAALYDGAHKNIFITEGAFDALSIIEAGGCAVSLNGTGNAKKFVDRMKDNPTGATLLLCLDNDKAGENAAAILEKGLKQLNIPCNRVNLMGGYNDPNEALTKDRAGFIEAVEEAKTVNGTRPDAISYYIKHLFAEDIKNYKTVGSTGLYNLDQESGGLYAGLYCIAAISSLGKTTFALQIADNLATAGNDVLFFSLEQSRFELVSKCIARRIAEKDLARAIPSLAIRKGIEANRVQAVAAELERDTGKRLSIIEGNFNCTASYISGYVREYAEATGTAPVVIVDYLQILKAEKDAQRQSVREVVDNTVTELKRLSRELGICVIIVSSVNRSNYLTPIDFESLKESGGIEYTCDVVYGLQLACLNEELFTKDGGIKDKRDRVREEKAKTPRKVELVCLKNRYGISSYNCFFDYYPNCDLFVPGEQQDADEAAYLSAKNSRRIRR